MAIYWPTPDLKGRMFKLCVLTRWHFNFCVRSSPLRVFSWNGMLQWRNNTRKNILRKEEEGVCRNYRVWNPRLSIQGPMSWLYDYATCGNVTLTRRPDDWGFWRPAWGWPLCCWVPVCWNREGKHESYAVSMTTKTKTIRQAQFLKTDYPLSVYIVLGRSACASMGGRKLARDRVRDIARSNIDLHGTCRLSQAF